MLLQTKSTKGWNMLETFNRFPDFRTFETFTPDHLAWRECLGKWTEKDGTVKIKTLKTQISTHLSHSLKNLQHISAHLNIPFPNSAQHFGHRWFEAFRFLTFAKCVVSCGIIWCPSVNVCSIFDISHDNTSSRVDASQRPYGRPQKVLTSSWVSYGRATAAPSASIWLSQSRFSMYTYTCV